MGLPAARPFTLPAGDRLISVGPDEGEDELIALCGEQPERLGTDGVSPSATERTTPRGQAEPDALLGDGDQLDVVEPARREPGRASARRGARARSPRS